eukprot:8252416-Alexandrium_andersonii.AAC.1
MSASLVGSEMCIRDRIQRARWRRTPRTRPLRVEFGANPEVFSGTAQFKSVSYTHLTLPTICSV